MPAISITVYLPKTDQQPQTLALLHEQMSMLRSQDFLTSFPGCVMQAESGAYVQVLEWENSQFVEMAEQSESFKAFATKLNEVSQVIPLRDLDESAESIARFVAVDWYKPVEYASASIAVDELNRQGYHCNFGVREGKLHCAELDQWLSADEFEIDRIYRYEGASDPGDETAVYAISSPKYHLKGVLVMAYGAYAEVGSGDMLRKLSQPIPETSYPKQEF
jgi:hypothetical protein